MYTYMYVLSASSLLRGFGEGAEQGISREYFEISEGKGDGVVKCSCCLW